MKAALRYKTGKKGNRIVSVNIALMPDDDKEEEGLRNLLRNVRDNNIIMVAAGPDTSIVVQGKNVAVDY